MAFVSDEPSFHSEFCSAKFLACSAYSAKLAGFISDVLVAISSGEFDRLWFLVYGLNRR
ncbi:predicted protein [Arabidopsis lyrata subsp. lyrata]|uniref:Predicted protein n=1 Tax=Arabidopsis lyrata subsp. lyrata TaxID=81972 RepID=D7LYB2_ARALL|nr:predicted protein [Arabidopsis lyrata subsp. lyrata]